VVRYVAEAEPGIASARNRALDEAGGSRLLAFIDDDERPHSGWLLRLLEARASTGAAAVAGAVVSEFDGPLDPWVRAGDFFRRRRPPTGTVITVAATNNLLLDLAVVRRHGLRFDGGFGLTGGSDTLFTRQLTAAGGLMVWCDEAVVTDRVPAARMTRDWVLRRAFRSGNSGSRVEMTLATSGWGRTLVRWNAARRGLPRCIGGGAQWAVGRACGRAQLQARGLRTAARGCGMLAGAFGVVYAEYRRVESAAVS
jgi:glycosyltransferase involved in cell wall biosynthesis